MIRVSSAPAASQLPEGQAHLSAGLQVTPHTPSPLAVQKQLPPASLPLSLPPSLPPSDNAIVMVLLMKHRSEILYLRWS